MMQYLLRLGQLRFRALLVCLLLGALPAQGQSAAPDPEPQCPKTATSPDGEEYCYVGNFYLKKTSFDVANMVCAGKNPTVCVLALIHKLDAMKPGDRCDGLAAKALIWRQQITEMVLTTSLQVDGFLAEIDTETAQIRAVHDQLADRRDTAVGHATLGSAIGTGGGAVGSVLALAANTAVTTAGSWVGAISGVFGGVFGFWGFAKANGPMGCFPDFKESGDKKEDCPGPKKPVELVNDPKAPCHRKGCSPSMLSEFLFGIDPGFHSDYDPVIKTYLESEGPGLIQWWGEGLDKKIEKLKPPNSTPDKLSIDDPMIKSLVANNNSPHKLSIGDLTDRANKLADVRAVVSRLNRDLSRLTGDLANGLRCDNLP